MKALTIDIRKEMMNQFRKYLYLFLFALLALSSCVTVKKAAYLQEIEPGYYSLDSVGVAPDAYRIQVYDNLFIRVVTPDPRWAEMFNTIPVTTGSVAYSEQSVELVSYVVKQDSTVDLPYLGSVPVAGRTLAETKQVLTDTLKGYITDAAITVKLVNNYISILGEVQRPGQYPIYKERMNIFQALALAGDLDEYSDRQQIKIVRHTEAGSVVKEFNINDRGILDTEFYYVMPNDVIYAQPMRGKFFAMSQFPFALILSSITTFVLVLNYIQPDNPQ